MTHNDYKNTIATQVANQAVNQLISELAAKCVEVDELKAQLDLYQKASGEPPQKPDHSP